MSALTSGSPASPGLGTGEPATVRVALWSARHRWAVLALWLAAMVGLLGASVALGGQRAQSIMATDEPIGESVAGWRAFSDAGTHETSEMFLLVVSNPSGRLDTPSGRAAVASVAQTLHDATATVDAQVVPVFAPDPSLGGESIADPFALAAADPASAGYVLAADGTTVLIRGRIVGDEAQTLPRTMALKPILATLQDAHPDLRILALNNRLINDDFGVYVNQSLDGLLRLTLPLTFLILLIAFRAVVAALVPLVLAVTSIMGSMGLVGIFSQLVSPISQYANQIVVLIGLAVAVDYSLFVVTRFRAERARGRERPEAIEIASATAGRAVFFSGLAVMISLGGLFAINDPTFHSIAVGAIAVVAISVIGSLTFLPATLAVLDRRVDRGRLPVIGRDRGEGHGIWATVVRFATDHPVTVTVVTAAILLGVAIPVGRLQLGSTGSDATILPDSIEGVQAVRLMDAHFPRGSNLTVEVVVTNIDGPGVRDAVARVETAALALPGVGGPPQLSLSGDGTVGSVAFTLPGGPNDRANRDVVRTLRTDVVPHAFAGVAGTTAYVTGQAAYTLDYGAWYGNQTPLVIGLVLALSFVLLLIAFHSVVIPIKAIVLNLLSAGAAFGVLVLVFQEGWLHDLSGIHPSPVEAWAPVMIFAILFGLSMDYHVFILTRVKEARDRGLSSTDAVVKGITITSGTVTSAAAIMVAVFSAFFTIQLTVIQQLGLGLAVAVLVDATLVRSLLLPATMRLLGDWNWWMPAILRWIPRVTIEGEPEALLGADMETI